MIVRPALLFLDEPTTGLDPRSREQLWGTVRKLADEGVTVLLTTQYLAEADQLADRIAMLDHGRIVAEGNHEQLLEASELYREIVAGTASAAGAGAGDAANLPEHALAAGAGAGAQPNPGGRL